VDQTGKLDDYPDLYVATPTLVDESVSACHLAVELEVAAAAKERAYGPALAPLPLLHNLRNAELGKWNPPAS
jgi:hypothetical protein